MKQYLELLDYILTHGKKNPTVQGVPALEICGYKMEFDLQEGFPLLTVRDLKGSWKGIRGELLWILSGSTHLKDLHKNNIHFWDQWGTEEICAKLGREPGDLGPIYGKQMRHFGARELPEGSYDDLRAAMAFVLDNLPADDPRSAAVRGLKALIPFLENGLDQVVELVNRLKIRPTSRRNLITTWDPLDVEVDGKEKVFIAPCHGTNLYAFVMGDKLTLEHTQRSGDVPIGIPFNIAEYALFLMMLAQVTGLRPHKLVHWIINAQIYESQIEHAKTMLKREPRPLPQVVINPEITDIFGFMISDFTLKGYDPHPSIPGIPAHL